MPESVFTQTIPALLAGGACLRAAGFEAGADAIAAVPPPESEVAAGAGLLAGAVETAGSRLAKGSVAGNDAASNFDGFGEAAAHRPKNKGGDLALRSQRNAGGFFWKFNAAVKLQSRLFEELSRKAHIFRAVHTPEPQLLFLALQEIQALLELLHGPVKGPGEKKDAELPGMTGVVNLNANTILAGLVQLDAAAVVVSNGGSTCSHVCFTDLKSPEAGFLWPLVLSNSGCRS